MACATHNSALCGFYEMQYQVVVATYLLVLWLSIVGFDVFDRCHRCVLFWGLMRVEGAMVDEAGELVQPRHAGGDEDLRLQL